MLLFTDHILRHVLNVAAPGKGTYEAITGHRICVTLRRI